MYEWMVSGAVFELTVIASRAYSANRSMPFRIWSVSPAILAIVLVGMSYHVTLSGLIWSLDEKVELIAEPDLA